MSPRVSLDPHTLDSMAFKASQASSLKAVTDRASDYTLSLMEINVISRRQHIFWRRHHICIKILVEKTEQWHPA